jgi:hypothetical protein
MSAFSVKIIGALDFRVYRNAATERMGSNNFPEDIPWIQRWTRYWRIHGPRRYAANVVNLGVRLTAGTFTLIEIISLRLAEVNKNRSEQGLPKTKC